MVILHTQYDALSDRCHLSIQKCQEDPVLASFRNPATLHTRFYKVLMIILSTTDILNTHLAYNVLFFDVRLSRCLVVERVHFQAKLRQLLLFSISDKRFLSFHFDIYFLLFNSCVLCRKQCLLSLSHSPEYHRLNSAPHPRVRS